MKQTIDTYKLTGMEEPTDEVLSQLMREVAEDVKRENDERAKGAQGKSRAKRGGCTGARSTGARGKNAKYKIQNTKF